MWTDTVHSLSRLLSLLALLALSASFARAQGFRDDSAFRDAMVPLEGTRPAQWRVVWHDDPCTRASVVWSTRERGAVHRLLLVGPRDGSSGAPTLTSPAFDTASEDVRVHVATNAAYTPHESEGSEPLGYGHTVRLQGLEPGSRYDFVLESDGQRSRPLYFFTAPSSGTDFTLLYGGDSRTGWRDRCRVNRMIADLTASDRQPLCFVHGGDYVERGDRSALWLRWLSHHELATAVDGRVLPIVPARGNHDWGVGYAEVFDAPGRTADGSGAWFRVDLGTDVSLITLDTNVSALGDQFVWIDDVLRRAREQSRWLLLNYHRPMFPAVKEPAAAAPFWVPTFERHDVDLVFESDGHVMKRTTAIKGGEPDPSGVTYLGEGGLGVPQRLPDGDHWYFGGDGFVGRGHHVTSVEFADDAITTRYFVLEDAPTTVDGATPLVPRGATWSYLAGTDASADWIRPATDVSSWPRGPAGFGYGDDDDATVLEQMHGAFERVYARIGFDVDRATLESLATLDLVLSVDFDDGFVAWLNGVEIARSAVASGRGPDAVGVTSHEAGTPELFDLTPFESLLRPDGNVLAVEGHNLDAESSDFSLHPALVVGAYDAADPTAVRYAEGDVHRIAVRPR